MDLERPVEIVRQNIIFSQKFPFRTGQLRDNFFDEGFTQLEPNSISFTVMSNPKIYYGKILQVAPSIRYRIKKVGYGYTYIKHTNRHFRFIDRICEEDAIPAIENDLGVKLI